MVALLIAPPTLAIATPKTSVEAAPASLQPSQPVVLVSEPVAALTLTGPVHVTLEGAAELEPDPGAGLGDEPEPPEAAAVIMALRTHPPRLENEAASNSG